MSLSKRIAPLVLSLVATFGGVLAAERALMTAPAVIESGGRSAVTLVVQGGGAGGEVPLRIELVGLDGVARLLAAGSAPRSGQRRYSFETPRVPADMYKIRASLTGVGALETEVQVSSAPAVLIETDKPIYRPSQLIQGRVVLLDRDLRPVAGSVEVTFFDGKGIRVARRTVDADEFGAAPFELRLASEVNQGRWRIRARSQGAESVRDLQVEHYTLPRFEANLDFPKRWALVDEPIAGAVTADYFFGKPVQGKVRLTASRWVGVWSEYASLEGTLVDGRWEFALPPVGFLAGTPQLGGRGAVRIDAEIVDSAGNAQTIADSLEISPTSVVLGVRALSRTVQPGLPLRLEITASTPAGEPASAPVDLEARFQTADQSNPAKTDRQTVQGRFLWTVVPPPNTYTVEILALTGVSGVPAQAAIRLASTYAPSGGVLELRRIDGDGPVRVGETLSYQVFATRSGTIYYEVFANGGTVFSDFSESGFFSFPVTVDMVPGGRVVAYQITPENEVAADSGRFETLLPDLGRVEAKFDSGPATPGQPVGVTLDTGLPGRALLGVSIVDESVLSLGRGRLHLEQLFEELERQFQEPQVQVVEEVFGPGLGIPFFAPATVSSARAVFREAGLRTATLGGVLIPEGFVWDDFGGPINLSPPPFEAPGGQAAAPDMPRVRQYFPETWVWNPTLLTDETGKARLTLTAPDSITSWKLAAVATRADSAGSGIGFGETSLTVFQDFFIEPAIPQSVVRGERFSLRIEIHNYLDSPQTVSIGLDPGAGLEPLSGTGRSVSAPANGATSVEFPVRATRVGEFPLRVTAIGKSHSDAVSRPIRVEPEGFPVEDVANGVIRAGRSVTLTPAVPDLAVADSARGILTLTPSLVGQSIQGVSDLLAMPYGCGEQNMIFLAPDIEVLKYLREIGELSPEIRATAENFVNTGYQRQLTFRTDDGGFAAFGGPTGSLWLTAFVLSTFSGAREVRDIDESVLSGAAAMLVGRQLDDGSFADDSFLIHTELAGGAVNRYTRAAYVTLALAEYGGSETLPALQRAAGFLERGRSDPEIHGNPYPLAIAAVALQKVSGFESLAELLVRRLLELGIRDQDGLHWEPFEVETTGYGAMALLGSVAGHAELQPALEWLSTRRNGRGGFGGSTQDTVVALRALFAAARTVNRSLDLEVEVRTESRLLGSFHLDRDNFDLLQQLAVPLDAPIELTARGEGGSNYQLATRYNLPTGFPPPSRDLDLKVDYASDHVDVDDLVDVTVSLLYRGGKPRTGMLIVDVSVPTGFDTVAATLDALVQEGVVQRVEAAGRKRIFYIEALDARQSLVFGFQIRALYPVRSAGVVSQAYDYYDSAVRAFDSLDEIEVAGGAPPPVVDAVSVSSAQPGTQIIIRGSGFLAGSPQVLFNGVAAADVEVIDDGTLRVTVPDLAPGETVIEVVTSGGRASLAGGGFMVKPWRLLFPLFANADGAEFNGYAFANFSDRPAQVSLGAAGDGETFARLAGRPALVALGPGEQSARLERELFPDAGPLDRSGWIEVTGDNSSVAGLYQFGGAESLDGCSPFRDSAKRFWFTRVHEGTSAFAGSEASTLLMVVNPHDEAVRLRFALVEGGGKTVVFRRLGPRQSYSGTVGSLFGRRSGVSRAYVEVVVEEGPGAIGFSRVDLKRGRSSFGLSASLENLGDRLWSAQLAYLRGLLSSGVSLVNTSPETRRATLQAIGDGGQPLDTAIVDLPPGGQTMEFVDRLFPALFSGSRESLSGSLRVSVDGAGVIGDVVFFNPATLESAAALPLQTQVLRRAVFGQVADGADFFSGLALHNPGAAEAVVAIRIRTPKGVMAGENRVRLAAGARLAREITQWAPSARGQVGGWIEIESDQPIVAQEIFGDRAGRALSAVPPTVLR